MINAVLCDRENEEWGKDKADDQTLQMLTKMAFATIMKFLQKNKSIISSESKPAF